MLRYEQKSIIFLINNGGSTIEVEIHDGAYNVIKNWNYIVANYTKQVKVVQDKPELMTTAEYVEDLMLVPVA